MFESSREEEFKLLGYVINICISNNNNNNNRILYYYPNDAYKVRRTYLQNGTNQPPNYYHPKNQNSSLFTSFQLCLF